MSWLRGIRYRLSELLHPTNADDELAQELRDHAEREQARQRRDGVDDDRAAGEAARRMGAVRAAREAVEDERTGHVIRDAASDLRMAGRAMRRSPGFSAAVVISLALGAGGTAATFAVVDAVLLRPLPYPDADRLFLTRIWWNDFSSTLSPADYLAAREAGRDVADTGAFYFPNDGFAMTTAEGPVLVTGAIITPDLARVLGVAPIAGAGFTAAPDTLEALIGEDLWRERYGASPDAIGKSLTLDNDVFTIVGVMPRGFDVPRQRGGSAWLKQVLRRPPTRRGPYYLNTVSRVPPGVAAEAAAQRLTTLVTPILRDRYAVPTDWRYGMAPLKETVVGESRPTLLLILGAMALVLLIAVVNVSSLMVARGSARARELAVRASLGAGRGRLARHLLAESALLGACGGIAGLAFAWLLLRAISGTAAEMIPRFDEVRFDLRLLLFTSLCGVGAGLLAGLVPAMRLPWPGLMASLRDGGRTASANPATARTRQVLVVVEIALTVAVLAGALLLAKSLMRLQAVDPGFAPNGIVTFRVALPDQPYEQPGRVAAFLADLEPRLRAIPGASPVAFAFALPPNRLEMSNIYTVEGATTGGRGIDGIADWQIVTPDYFDLFSIRIARGRAFTPSDRDGAEDVAIVNDAFVRRHYPDGQAIGKRFQGGEFNATRPWTTIVGVVGDVSYEKGVGNAADPMVYLPFAQHDWPQAPYVAIRTRLDAATTLVAARQAVEAIDRSLPLRDTATMAERLNGSMREARARSLLFSLIAGLALALAITGIYGVMSYHVAQRRRETAIRRALGASVSSVIAGTVSVGLRVTLAGLAIGAAGALVLTSGLRTMLFQVDPRDPATLATVAATLAAAALVACAIPAARSARIDPAIVLRDE